MFGLKRLRIRSKYHPLLRDLMDRVFQDCEKIIIQQQFTTSPKDFLVLCEVRWKNSIKDQKKTLDSLAGAIDWVDEITVISSYKDRTLGLLKGSYDAQYTALFTYTTQEFMTFLEYPVVGYPEYGEGSLVGPIDEVNRLLEFLRDWGSELEIRAVTDYNPRDRGILTVLTDRQRDVLKTAYDMGYFDHPKKKDARDIAYKLGISHTTFLTHIRKAQKRIIGTLLEE